MPDRVLEHTVTYAHRDTGTETTVRYFVGASDQYRNLADSVAASELTQDEVDALDAYNDACEDGKARFITRTTKAVE